jgi:hypothetical protein
MRTRHQHEVHQQADSDSVENAANDPMSGQEIELALAKQ